MYADSRANPNDYLMHFRSIDRSRERASDDSIIMPLYPSLWNVQMVQFNTTTDFAYHFPIS